MKMKIHMKKIANFNFLATMCYCNSCKQFANRKKNIWGTIQTYVTLFHSFVKKNIFPLKGFTIAASE